VALQDHVFGRLALAESVDLDLLAVSVQDALLLGFDVLARDLQLERALPGGRLSYADLCVADVPTPDGS
jgi:hypothetical protein